nr:FAD-dependent oxidoreductase [Deinococcus maricopensis]
MRMVVVGGVAAGMSAASRARRANPDAEIVVFERGAWVSYGACGLPYALAQDKPDWDVLVARTPQQLRGRGLHVQLEHEVTGVDARARTVTVRGPGGSRTEPYDELLIATGVSAVQPAWSVPGLAGVHTLRTMADAQALDASVRGARRVAIIGGGYIGLELAEALRARGLSVALLEAQEDVAGRALDPEVAAPVRAEVERGGVDVRTGVTVEGLGARAGRVTGVHTSAGFVRTDVVVVAVGVRANAELARAAGARLGRSGAVRVDVACRTAVPGVWAAGDVCEVRHRVSRRFVHVPLGLTANRMGRVAGVNMTGGAARFPGIVGTGIFKVFGLGVARTGLTLAEARAVGLDAVAVDSALADRPGYYPGHAPLHVRLVAERASGRLLGGQLVGQPDAVKRVDVLAATLHARGTVHDLEAYDLAYAPPFSTVWDALLVAAGRTARALGRPPPDDG